MKKEQPSSEARTHLLKMRKLMRAETNTLLKELHRHQNTLAKRLRGIEQRLRQDADASLLSELATIRDEIAAVRRGLARLSLAEQSTLKLKNEWHDWARHEEYSDDANHALRVERLEMIASELRLRGVKLPEARIGTQRDSATSVRRLTIEEVTVSEPSICENPSNAADISLMEPETTFSSTDWNEVCLYWDRLISGCDPSHTDVTQLARLLKTFREVQGERKRADKRHGIRRYRLDAFDAWVA